MIRLSILIPFLGNRDSLENTLVSVLEHRPEDVEIVVALGQEYDDPYQLGEEVRFVRVASAATPAPVLNQGIPLCQAPVVHTLACGVAVAEGWIEPALRHFDDRRVASVAPLAVQADDPQRISAAGLEYHCSGNCRRRGRGTPAQSVAQFDGESIGPSCDAGFYRRAALGNRTRVFDPALGSFADFDLALRLLEAGYRTVCEPASIVFQSPLPLDPAGGWTQARQSEQLFWRHAAKFGWPRSIAAHLALVAGEFARSLPRPRALAQLAGRCLASCAWGSLRRQNIEWELPPLRESPIASDARQMASERQVRSLAPPHFPMDSQKARAKSREPVNENSSS